MINLLSLLISILNLVLLLSI